MSRGDAFSGVVPDSTQCPIVAPAPSTAVVFSAITRNRRAWARTHSNPAIVVHFFARGELDGAEGIDSAET